MGQWLRALTLVVTVLVAGAFLGSALSQWWDVPAEPAPAGPTRPTERVRVEVLNGGGQTGMARAATDRLRDGGYDVVYYGNAGTFSQDASVVLDRNGRVDLARDVADRLGIRDVRIEPDSNLYLDVTVWLGQEWSPPVERVETADPAWWDVRRFFRRDSSSHGSPKAAADTGEQG